jgi:hypothetical protein
MMIKPRSVLLCVAVTVLLVFTLAPSGAPAAARPSAARSCADTVPVFFGLHGMYEGPSKTVPAISPEIEGFDYEQNLISGAVGNYPVSYTTATVGWKDIADAADIGPLTAAVKNGEKHLQSDLAAYTKGCTLAQDKIALLGYSMGAWVVNRWLKDHPSEWIKISAVVMYGDPCWVHGPDAGLLRLFNPGDGCSPAKDYPYPAPTPIIKVPFLAKSYCLAGDPVCGGGFNSHRKKQLSAALKCSNAKCPHNQYQVGRPGQRTLKLGAQFVVQQLVG